MENRKNVDAIDVIFLARFLQFSCSFLAKWDYKWYICLMERLLQNHPEYKRLKNLILYLSSHPGEEDWFDFKENNANPDEIGEYVSALSNAALLCNHQNGYLIWGVEDSTHELKGTAFHPAVAKKGGEELENYLAHMTTPSLALVFYALEIEGRDFVVLQIPRAKSRPTAFAGKTSIRIGSNTHLLSKYPEKERKLWAALASSVFETETCKEELDPMEALRMLEFSAYYSRRNIPVPQNLNDVVETFLKERFLTRTDSGKMAITNLGALLFARDLYDFQSLAGKAIRVIRYPGKSRVSASSETEFHQGYAVMFDEVVRYIEGLQNQREEIKVYRTSRGVLPNYVIREALANMMAHQDLLDNTANPMVQLFPHSVEMTNPGKLLVDVARLIDTTPVCRNEMLARCLRLLRIIEDRGSGFDRIEEGLSSIHAPSILVQSDEYHTCAILSSKDSFKDFTEEEALNTIYTSCCFGYVNLEEKMGNAYFRQRLGLTEKDASVVSRLLAKAVEQGRVKLSQESTGARNRYYVPNWA